MTTYSKLYTALFDYLTKYLTSYIFPVLDILYILTVSQNNRDNGEGHVIMLYQEKRRTASQFVKIIFAMEIIEFIYTSHQ